MIALAMSGGLDSVAAWWVLGKPRWIFVTGANPHVSTKETEAVQKLCEMDTEFAEKGEIIEFDLSPFQSPHTNFFPRESFVAALAVGKGFTEVWFGYHSWDRPRPNPADGDLDLIRTEFLSAYGHKSNIEFRARLPLVNLSRVEIINRALAKGCPPEFLLASWSCQKAGEHHCGDCRNCVERAVAFHSCGLSEKYEGEPSGSSCENWVITLAHNEGASDLIRRIKEQRGIPEGEPIYV